MPRLLRQDEPSAAPQPIDFRSDAIRIGRIPGNEIEVVDSLVSRRHAEIKNEGGAWVLYDLDSMNGTFVNDQRVSKQVLKPGDKIAIGKAVFFFDEGAGGGGGAQPGPMAMAQGAPAAGGEAPSRTGSGEIIKSVDQFQKQFQEKSLRSVINRPPSDPSRHFYILYQIGRVINSSNGLEDLLSTAMQLIFEAINAERGGIFLLNDKGIPELKHSRFRSPQEGTELVVSRTILKKVIHERVAILTSDAKYDPRFEAGQSIAAFNIRSALCVPIWDKNEISGVVYLDNQAETYAFAETDMDLLSAIANQIAIGVQNLRLADQLKVEAVRRSNLEMYHSPDVVEMLLHQSGDMERSALGVREAEVTVLFSDICGFTTMSTKFKPSEIAFILNGYFDAMTKVIFAHKGSINKFIGDAIMAIYGAPVQHQNDAAMAVQSAIEMLKALREYLTNLDETKHFKIRIGINTGELVVGNIGSSRRMEYTVLGDSVNTAQRLESVAPHNGILIGERTKQLVEGLFKLRDVGLLKLKGKEPTRAYEVLF
ncbi:MAG: adenylate/guanylate cyclase domain-containing protein [Bdellovibrionota bacterium]